MLKKFQFCFLLVCLAATVGGCGSATRDTGQVDPNVVPPPNSTTSEEPADLANGADGKPIGAESAGDAVAADPLNP